MRDFLPSMMLHRCSLRPRVGTQFFRELAQPGRWKLDQPSPFEAIRVLDPPAYQPILDQARTHAAAAFPVFRNMRVAQSWGGIIDVTPDEIPVISGVDTLPGFFIATGFTGHGFGIAPGAGRLMAELVTGETPVVDPTPFRYSRFLDGSRPQPSPLA
jgi:glycine/D-amino acid oxidase-like deaminating enzyme